MNQYASEIGAAYNEEYLRHKKIFGSYNNMSMYEIIDYLERVDTLADFWLLMSDRIRNKYV